MGEVLILIIIALVWGFKAAVANEDKKVNDRETGSISASPDELIKKANRTLDDLDTMRAKERESKKRPSGVQIRDFHKNLSHVRSRPTAVRSIPSTWTAARTGSKA